MEQWPVALSPDAQARWVEGHFEGTLMGLLRMQDLEVSKTRAVVELPVHAGLTTPSDISTPGAWCPWLIPRPPLPQWRHCNDR